MLLQLTNTSIGEIGKIGENCTKLTSVGRFSGGLLLFVRSLLDDDPTVVLARQGFWQMPCHERLPGNGDGPDILVDQKTGTTQKHLPWLADSDWF
jgi:hypothetical protein